MLFHSSLPPSSFFFFFNDTATTEIYTLSLHDALPIFLPEGGAALRRALRVVPAECHAEDRERSHRGCRRVHSAQSGEHTPLLPALPFFVCRLFLVKKKNP